MTQFYQMYTKIVPQDVAQMDDNKIMPQVVAKLNNDEISPQIVDELCSNFYWSWVTALLLLDVNIDWR